jgi:hypothetical protein
MKEIEKNDLPDIGGGVWNDGGCTTPFPDPTIDPKYPMPPGTDPTAPLLLDL